MAIDESRDHLGRSLRCLEHCALHRRTISLRCPGCGRQRHIDAVALWWLFQRKRWDDSLPKVRQRLFCSQCPTKRRPVLAVTGTAPEGPQPPYPDEYSWKRLVRRYRS